MNHEKHLSTNQAAPPNYFEMLEDQKEDKTLPFALSPEDYLFPKINDEHGETFHNESYQRHHLLQVRRLELDKEIADAIMRFEKDTGFAVGQIRLIKRSLATIWVNSLVVFW